MSTVWASWLFFLFSVSFQSAFGSSWLDECNRALGLQDGRVHDSQISATSFYEDFYIGNGKTVHTKAQYARLNNRCAWCAPGGRNHYIKVDFNQNVMLTGIATQGFSGINDYFVKSFRVVVYRRDGVKLHKRAYMFTANSDSQKVVKNTFPAPISAQYIRVYPVSFMYNICLRMELYGCRNFTVGANSSVAVSTTLTGMAHTKPEIQNNSNSGKSLSTSTPQDSFLTTTPVPNMNHTPSRTIVKAPTHASKQSVAEQGADGGEQLSLTRTPDPVLIGSLVTASLLLLLVVPFVMFLIFLRHYRQRRYFSSYEVGSYVVYGVPLTSGVNSSDRDAAGNQEIDEINATKEQFNTDEINLLSPCAV